ncbi:hypothetical protein OH76DRAFT_1557000, partial [Lentinus brumalis]
MDFGACHDALMCQDVLEEIGRCLLAEEDQHQNAGRTHARTRSPINLHPRTPTARTPAPPPPPASPPPPAPPLRRPLRLRLRVLLRVRPRRRNQHMRPRIRRQQLVRAQFPVRVHQSASPSSLPPHKEKKNATHEPTPSPPSPINTSTLPSTSAAPILPDSVAFTPPTIRTASVR